MPTAVSSSETSSSTRTGKWVTAAVYGEFHGIPEETLANWRYRDKLAGRTEALPGFPKYQRFGRAVRYSMEATPAEFEQIENRIKSKKAARVTGNGQAA